MKWVNMKFFILMLLLITTSTFADELKIQYDSGTGIIPQQSSEDHYLIIDGKRYKNNKIPAPDDSRKNEHGNYGKEDSNSFKGYPYYGNPYSLTPNRTNPPIIVKEKETIRETIRDVPVEIPQPVKEKKWIPPVYSEKVISGHYINGISETVDENGVRVFTDDDTIRRWVPEKTIMVITTPGHYE